MKTAPILAVILLLLIAQPAFGQDNCTNSVQDGNETGIDCGGSCPACACVESFTTNCANPCQLSSTVHDLNPKVRQFDNLNSRQPVCINLNGINKTSFYPQVDDFSLLSLPLFNASFDYMNTSTSEYYVQLQFGSQYTSKQYYRYRSNGVQYVVPFFTVVITLNNGEVEKLDWDTGCQACTDDECNNNICGVPESSCIDKIVDCDLKVYLAWSGSDDNNRYMLSSGSVLSRFSAYSISNAWKNAATTFSTTYPGGRSAF